MVNGTTKISNETVELSSLPSVKQKGEVWLTLGGPKDGDDVKLLLRWVPMVITFSTGETGDGHINVREELIKDLEPFDIKLSSELHQLTKFYMKPTSNSSKLLTALVKCIPIVTFEFSKALKKACEVLSGDDSMETDFYKNFPNAEQYIPDPAMAPNSDRMKLFENKVFIFPQTKERDALLGAITSGGGKAYVYEMTSAHEPPSRIKDFVLSKVKNIDNLVLVGYHTSERSNQEDIDKLLVLNNAAKMIGTRLFAASDFLTVILEADASKLNLRRPDEDGAPVSFTEQPKRLGTASFLETSIRVEAERKPGPIRRRKPQTKQLNIMDLMATTKREPDMPVLAPNQADSLSMNKVADSMAIDAKDGAVETADSQATAKEPDTHGETRSPSRRKRRERINDDIITQTSTFPPDVTQNAREYKRRKLDLQQASDNKSSNVDDDMFAESVPALIEDEDNNPDEDSSEPKDGHVGVIKKWSGDLDDDSEDSDDDLAGFENLAIVEATLEFRQHLPKPKAPTVKSKRPNFKGFRMKEPRKPPSMKVDYMEAAPTDMLLEQDMSMFANKERYTKRKLPPVESLQNSSRSKRRKETKTQAAENMFVNSDDSLSEDESEVGMNNYSSAISNESRPVHSMDDYDEDDEDELSFRFSKN
ncbi:hypothetical protein AWJ20_4836 [Sugiyamaella lignohabitans]|uniref:Nibrin second BRCT domain-containing protein n=1 Tax=Sugiyamaella lignohabitans TaxID=796027 RepID=A0A167EBY4_9ASCO|nr:uncharacterized protein AWJ20_4836 [Sugiyamaella lignohabitans]ANB13885.1 hypothetical protein AWJ20_4836 [Sugiyamaella lignohabitans]